MGWGSQRVGWFGSVTGLLDDGVKNPNNYLNTLLHKTEDGGETWHPVTNLPKAAPAGICGFCAVNERVAYGSGTNDPRLPGPGVLKTTDGGATWQLIDMTAHADNLIDIYFFNEKVGFVVGGKNASECPLNNPAYPPPRLSAYVQLMPVVLRTLDGGLTWENMAEKTAGFLCGEWGWKIQFLNRMTGFVSLENFAGAAILKTVDGGETWTRLDIKDATGKVLNVDLEGIGFIDENRGWVGGWGDDFTGLLNSYTMDGGQTWTPQNSDPANPSNEPRIRINRYRFIGNPVTAGYCSGQQVYKLQFGAGPKKLAFAAKSTAFAAKPAAFAAKSTAFAAKPSAFAQDAPRQEPAHGGVQPGKQALPPVGEAVASPQPDFKLASSRRPDGKLEIRYELPVGMGNVFIGIWNQFAFYITTLLHADSQPAGPQILVWDGRDDQGNPVGPGAYICRFSFNGRQGGSLLVQIP